MKGTKLIEIKKLVEKGTVLFKFFGRLFLKMGKSNRQAGEKIEPAVFIDRGEKIWYWLKCEGSENRFDLKCFA